MLLSLFGWVYGQEPPDISIVIGSGMTKHFIPYSDGTRCLPRVHIAAFSGSLTKLEIPRFSLQLQHWFFNQIGVDNLTVDFDRTVITRYGDQQGSSKGYNPNKRGRNSHHPLMAFVSQTRMVANAWLRPGNTADNSSCKAFMQDTFDQALKGKRIGLICADIGFYTEELLGYLESEKHNYIMAVRMYANVKSAVWGLDNWVNLDFGNRSQRNGL